MSNPFNYQRTRKSEAVKQAVIDTAVQSLRSVGYEVDAAQFESCEDVDQVAAMHEELLRCHAEEQGFE